ncbi:uncharacterized protein LOC142231423 [Haematobia irritans]|uniref:uncharacterized protein LOC142231423 n=1 Tax=Haematobia irritans TaxID=7368 RepID=UPI003F50B173
MLLNAVNKLLSAILLNRISVESILRNEQAEFRSGRSCTDPINTVRIFIEQSIGYNCNAYLLFVNLESAFNTVSRSALWDGLSIKGISPKIVNLIRELYRGAKYKLRYNGEECEEFETEAGVKQALWDGLSIKGISPKIVNLIRELYRGAKYKLRYNGEECEEFETEAGVKQELGVKSILPYGCITWSTTQNSRRKLQSFHNKCLKQILKIFWSNWVTNDELLAISNRKPIEADVRRRTWIGNILRRPCDDMPDKLLSGIPRDIEINGKAFYDNWSGFQGHTPNGGLKSLDRVENPVSAPGRRPDCNEGGGTKVTHCAAYYKIVGHSEINNAAPLWIQRNNIHT